MIQTCKELQAKQVFVNLLENVVKAVNVHTKNRIVIANVYISPQTMTRRKEKYRKLI